MVSHYLDEVEALADKILYLENGRNQFFGTKQGFREYAKSRISSDEWEDNLSLEKLYLMIAPKTAGLTYDGAEVRMMDVSVPAYAVMVMGVTGLMSLPLTMSGYKEKKIYKRFDATPVGKRTIMLAQVVVNLIMTLIGIVILLAAGRLLYQIQIKGSFFLFAWAYCSL